MAAGTVPWCGSFGEVSVHIRDFKQGTHKNSHKAHSSNVPRSQIVTSCKGAGADRLEEQNVAC